MTFVLTPQQAVLLFTKPFFWASQIFSPAASPSRNFGWTTLKSRPSVYYSEAFSPLLRVYVDGLTVFGRMEVLHPLIAPLHNKVLSRTYKEVAFSGFAFARHCVVLYYSTISDEIKKRSIRHIDLFSLPPCVDSSAGQLASTAARIIVKILWLARLARPDLVVSVATLVFRVSCWSFKADCCCAIVVRYILATTVCASIMYVHVKTADLHLAFCLDSDFRGCVETARSTFGHIIALGGDSSLKLSWFSKQQKESGVGRSSCPLQVPCSETLFPHLPHLVYGRL